MPNKSAAIDSEVPLERVSAELEVMSILRECVAGRCLNTTGLAIMSDLAVHFEIAVTRLR